ncbi:MAG: NADH-quinone oxidoreductase subunit L [Planctomycetaceae bacterium]
MDAATYQSTGETLKTLLTFAWLLPLAGFAIEIFGGYWGDRRDKKAAYLAVACIFTGFVLSTAALVTWGKATHWAALSAEVHHGAAHHSVADDAAHPAPAHPAAAHSEAGHAHAEGGISPKTAFNGTYYTLAEFGSLKISLDYYIDSLTLVMFTMVTLIATCIHIFAMGYMHEELTDNYADHHVHVSGGGHLHRPGRFYRFFAYMSLFCFSMLGLVIAGNIFMVFVFWELVGICSYFLIGFYVERKSASTAANKAFIMNRVGDFGFLIGLMILWTWFGTFQFGAHEIGGVEKPGLFEMVRGEHGALDVDQAAGAVRLHGEGNKTIPYTLLVTAGLGIFAGCIGKSAQFPLQTWLPDAMEGPTPVSALVHSATMVAAGVYLAGRFFPIFTPEVLLTISYVGCITLFVAATIAIVATDIKRVLAYSTISQLGYMMLAIGLGGWGAGLFHLITHAFFKSLMFLASGSVIAGCHHEQEMPRMGGLLKKMPITGYAMLVGVIAISGLAIPGVTVPIIGQVAFSGYHSKDAIVATALAYMGQNPSHFLLFWVPLITAGITAFYMFRLWFYTFYGTPRDKELYDHVHESPWVMTGPLIVLSFFAAFVAAWGESGVLYKLLIHSEPAGVAAGAASGSLAAATILFPSHDAIHAVHSTAGMWALVVASIGTVLAFLLYGIRVVNPAEIARQFATLHHFLVEKWQFDNLYDAMFTRPAKIVAAFCAAFDRKVFDGFLHALCRWAVSLSRWDRKFDESVVDGLVNLTADATFAIGRSLRTIQTGLLLQYVMFIALSVLTLFVLLFTLFPK